MMRFAPLAGLVLLLAACSEEPAQQDAQAESAPQEQVEETATEAPEQLVPEQLDAAAEAVEQAAGDVADAAQNVIEGVAGAAAEAVDQAGQAVSEAVGEGTTADEAVDAVTDAAGGVVGALQGAAQEAADQMADAMDATEDASQEVASDVAEGAEAATEAVEETVEQAAQEVAAVTGADQAVPDNAVDINAPVIGEMLLPQTDAYCTFSHEGHEFVFDNDDTWRFVFVSPLDGPDTNAQMDVGGQVYDFTVAESGTTDAGHERRIYRSGDVAVEVIFVEGEAGTEYTNYTGTLRVLEPLQGDFLTYEGSCGV